jgi:hypothetical protein
VPFANFQSSRFWVALCSFERFALIFCFHFILDLDLFINK